MSNSELLEAYQQLRRTNRQFRKEIAIFLETPWMISEAGLSRIAHGHRMVVRSDGKGGYAVDIFYPSGRCLTYR